MMDLTVARLKQHRLIDRTEIHIGRVDSLPAEPKFDAATLIGVLHHLPDDEAKRDVLQSVGARLKPGAPFILAGNRFAYASKPLLLAAWAERWRMKGTAPDEIKAKLGTILHGAHPPDSDDAVIALLAGAGFEQPIQFFSSLFWGAWLAYRAS